MRLLDHISIHAPTRGATLLRIKLVVYDPLFQSTPPRGGRRIRPGFGTVKKVISIHAPTRGATW